MPRLINLISLFLISILIFSCIETIDFEQPDSLKDAISIQGKLTKGDPSTVNVTINNIFDFDNFPKFITARKVQLIDEQENILDLKTEIQGQYNLEIPINHPTFKIEYEKGYSIKVELLDGQIVQSAFDTLLPVPAPSSLNIKKIKKELINIEGVTEPFDFIEFSVSTPLFIPNSSKSTYFLWELESVYKQSDSPTQGAACNFSCRRTSLDPKPCFLSINPVKNYVVLDATELSGDFIDNFLLLEEIKENAIFAEGYYLTLYQQSLSAEAFNYWSKVNSVVNRVGTQFESPVGIIPSNFTSIESPNRDVHGYFFATESKLKRIYVSPEFADNPRPICPPPEIGNNAICCNCLCQQFSSTEKPDYWVE